MFENPIYDVSTTPVPVRQDELLARICVRPPYFNLQQLLLEEGTLQAVAPTELRLDLEQAPMGAAEMGRHAAIAGLCVAALAQRDDDRRYYLAQRANFTGYPVGAYQGDVQFQARLTQFDKRRTAAQIDVSAGNKALALLEVSYTVFTETIFERLFGTKRQATVLTPAYDAEMAGTFHKAENEISFEVPVIPLTVCAGHFDHYPALPVAVLMSYLVRLGGKFMGGFYRSVYGVVEAADLCWAGESVQFQVTHLHHDGLRHHFRGWATSAGRVMGEMLFGLEEV